MILSIVGRSRKLARLIVVPLWRVALLRHYVAAGPEHGFVMQHLGEIRTVVDIGANCGQFALAARHFFPAAHIESFEPLSEAADVYKSVFANDSNTTLYEVAIGPESGEATIHISRRADSSSLLPIGAVQDRLFPGTAQAGTATIKVAPLSAYVVAADIDGPALLKLDVQGFELQALKGCEEALESFTWVYVECSFIELYEGQALADEVIAWLRDRDFGLCGIYNTVYDAARRPVQADFLFGKKAV